MSRESDRAYYLAHRDQKLASNRRWRRANRERLAAYRVANRARRNAYDEAYKRVNRDRQTQQRQAIKAEVIARYGGRCARCGFTDMRALCIDHVNGDGHAHRRALVGQNKGGSIHRWLLKQDRLPGFQVLCANCNMIKAMEQGEYRGAPRGPRQRIPVIT